MTRRGVVAGGAALAALAALQTPRPAQAWDFFGVDIDRIKGEAADLYGFIQDAVSSFKALDFEAALTAVQGLTDLAATMDEELDQGLWPWLEYVPVYGEDVAAARMLVSVMSDVCDQALMPLAQALQGVTPSAIVQRISSSEMQIDLPTVQRISQVLVEAIPSVSAAADAVEAIGELHVDQLASVVSTAKDQLVPVSRLLSSAASILEVLPGFLGANGPRTYAIIAQNNVEIRATGGLPGQMTAMWADQGYVSIGDVGGVTSFMGFWEGSPVCDLTEEDLALYYPTIAERPANTNCNPDFPRDCEIWSIMWQLKRDEVLSGVVALDPPTLQMLMGLTQGVDLSNGKHLDGTNLCRALVYETYMQNLKDYSEQDRTFTEAAGEALSCVLGNLGNMDLMSLIDVFRRARDERRLFIWSAVESEQAVLDKYGYSGSLVLDPEQPKLGVYLNNASWSKIEWWLNEDIQVGEPQVNDDGSSTYACELTLSNAGTWEEFESTSFDANIAGGNVDKYGIDDILDGLLLYAPAGGSIDILSSENCSEFQQTTHRGLQVWWAYAHNCIGAPAKVRFEVHVPAGALTDLCVSATPTVQDYR